MFIPYFVFLKCNYKISLYQRPENVFENEKKKPAKIGKAWWETENPVNYLKKNTRVNCDLNRAVTEDSQNFFMYAYKIGYTHERAHKSEKNVTLRPD